MGIRHPTVFKRVAEHLVGSVEDEQNEAVRGLSEFSNQGLATLGWSYAKQAQLAISMGGNGKVAIYETSCLDIGENLIRRLFFQLAEHSKEKFSTKSPQDISNTVWAFATLGILHNELFDAVSEEVYER